MATNDFLPFAVGSGANVSVQSDYAALPAIAAGYSAGIAKSAQINKTMRQSSIMAAVLAQFISDQTGANSTDDGTTATLLINLKKSMPGRLLRTSVYTNNAGTLQVSIDGAAFVTASSTFTPLSSTNSVDIEGCGAGGGGGGALTTSSGQSSAGSGGSAGAWFRKRILSGFVGVTVAVGAPGSVSTGNPGTSGGTTSFGAIVSGPGGPGGPVGSAQSNTSSNFIGGGGKVAASGGDINGEGIPGQAGFLSVTPIGGGGGSSPYGAGALISSGTSGGNTSNSFGAGGGGACLAANNAINASGGAPQKGGVLIVREYA